MVGGMHGEGHVGGGVHGGGMHGRQHAWQGGMCGRGHAWQGACMVGVGVWWGHAWQKVCMARGMHRRRDGHCSGLYPSYWNAFLFEQ